MGDYTWMIGSKLQLLLQSFIVIRVKNIFLGKKKKNKTSQLPWTRNLSHTQAKKVSQQEKCTYYYS